MKDRDVQAEKEDARTNEALNSEVVVILENGVATTNEWEAEQEILKKEERGGVISHPPLRPT